VDDKIPKLYTTERIPLERKIIYQRYQIKEIGFYWLIAELDKEENLAFGYANLNDDQLALRPSLCINRLIHKNLKTNYYKNVKISQLCRQDC